MEIWKQIKHYEGIYEVSNYGNVRSIDRMEKFMESMRLRKGKMIKIRYFNKYAFVMLTKNAIAKSYFVHRLVAQEFIGDINGKVVDHIDFNPSNNHVDNLQILTQKENINRGVLKKRHNFGEKHGMSKLTENDIRNLRNAKKGSISDLCKQIGITYSTAKKVRRLESWTHVI